MKARIARLLESRAIIAVSAVLAVVLLLPTLTVGFMMDDYAQLLWLKGGPQTGGRPGRIWDMFAFLGTENAPFRTAIDKGFCPWWTNPELKLAFLRPVTSLTHALDHSLFPNSPALMRLESLLMYAVVVIVIGLLYRRISKATVAAGLAIWMYALDDAHAVTASWISNRNAVIAAIFGFGALYLFDRGAREGDKRARMLAPVLFALGLLSAEAAAATLGYLVAHAVWMQKERWQRRVMTLAPFFGVVVVWTAVYKLGGYGAWGGEFYIDPGREPVRFFGALAQRLPVLLHGQLSFPPSDMWMLVPFDKHVLAFVVLLVTVLLGAVVLVFGLRRTNENAFYATGMLLALVPVCATFPGDRLLLFAGFGAFGLIGDFLTAPRDELTHARRFVVRGAAGYFIVLHVVLTPFVFYPGRTLQLAHMLHDPIERADASYPKSAELVGKTLIVVNGPDFLIPEYGLVTRARRDEPLPDFFRLLTIATQGRVMVRRTGERTLEVVQTKGFFHEPFSMVFRKADKPLQLGEQVKIAGMTATAKAYTSDRKRIGAVEFELDAPLEDPRYVWVSWRTTKFEPFVVPAVGEEVEIPAIDYQVALQGE